MKFSTSSQDYLEAILELSNEQGQIRSIDLSRKLSVTRPSVNRAVGVLKRLGYITQERYSKILLTDAGKRAANSVIMRHSTLKIFLVEILGVSEETAEIDACKMEHTISLETLGKLRGFMNSRKQERDNEILRISDNS